MLKVEWTSFEKKTTYLHNTGAGKNILWQDSNYKMKTKKINTLKLGISVHLKTSLTQAKV